MYRYFGLKPAVNAPLALILAQFWEFPEEFVTFGTL